jgi:very-short-patch-repair endonuclease
MRSKDACRSNGQYQLGRQLSKLYSGYTVLEEFSIPESRLAIDFFVPNAKIAFEFQGIQHDEFNKHFHVDATGFRTSKRRDADKKRWCKINGITLVEVRDEHITLDKLRELICQQSED